jgi:hypothetical protein
VQNGLSGIGIEAITSAFLLYCPAHLDSVGNGFAPGKTGDRPVIGTLL